MTAPRLALTVAEAAKTCGVGEDAIRTAEKTGELIGSWVGRRPVIQPKELEAWLDTVSQRRARAS